MASFWSVHGLREMFDGTRNLASVTIDLRLLTTAYSPTKADQFWSSISTHEITDSLGSYVAGGTAVSSKAFTTDTVNFVTYLTWAAISWTPVSASNVRWAVSVVDTGTAGTSVILGIHDLGGTYNPSNGLMRLTPGATGALQLAA